MNMINKSFFKKATAEERQKMIRQNMMVSPITNNSAEYARPLDEIKQSHDGQQPQLISVNLMQLRPFDNNPRKTRNPKFDEIKESIRMRGLDFAPNITKRPGEDFYIIADGGNTRLQALNELWEETHDPKYWSVRCLFKPWKGDVEGDLSCLIGHLAENDLRGDLSFIERALAIADIKTMYEKTGELGEQKLSHRQLSERLKADGYRISHPVLVRMEQCLNYLYPVIPNILLAGMGKPQIEKLLVLRNNALSFWQTQGAQEAEFTAIWQQVLSAFDADPPAFNLSYLQDELIGAMVSKLDNGISYEDIRFEIDIDEQKQRRREEKIFQTSFQNNDGEPVKTEAVSISPSLLTALNTDTGHNNHNTDISSDAPAKEKKTAPPPEETSDIPFQSQSQKLQEMTADSHDKIAEDNALNIFGQFGMTPGMSIREQQEKRAEHNGLTFANTGHQPVTDIWQIFPAFDSFKRLAAEANGLAYDILRDAGLNPKLLIQYLRAHEDIGDFTFTLAPLPAGAAGNPLSESVYELMAMLASDKHDEMLSWTVPEELLVGNTENAAIINDTLLVKIFRLIRIVRRMREHLR